MGTSVKFFPLRKKSALVILVGSKAPSLHLKAVWQLEHSKMLVLYETALGYCLFKVTDSAKLEKADLWKEFESPERTNKL
jgi:hypothetical protein